MTDKESRAARAESGKPCPIDDLLGVTDQALTYLERVMMGDKLDKNELAGFLLIARAEYRKTVEKIDIFSTVKGAAGTTFAMVDFSEAVSVFPIQWMQPTSCSALALAQYSPVQISGMIKKHMSGDWGALKLPVDVARNAAICEAIQAHCEGGKDVSAFVLDQGKDVGIISVYSDGCNDNEADLCVCIVINTRPDGTTIKLASEYLPALDGDHE